MASSDALQYFPGVHRSKRGREDLRMGAAPLRPQMQPPGWRPGQAGRTSPSADHWSAKAMGRSTSRETPWPRGSRPSTAALMIAGSRKANDNIIRIERSVRFSRFASPDTSETVPATSSSSQRRAKAIALSRRACSSTRIGRTGPPDVAGRMMSRGGGSRRAMRESG